MESNPPPTAPFSRRELTLFIAAMVAMLGCAGLLVSRGPAPSSPPPPTVPTFVATEIAKAIDGQDFSEAAQQVTSELTHMHGSISDALQSTHGLTRVYSFECFLAPESRGPFMNGLIERVRADIDGHGGAILKERIIQGGRGNGSKEFDFTYLCQATHGSIVCRSIDDNNRVIRILMVITESPAVL